VCIWGRGRGTCREQLYAQIQADAAVKKAQEQVCRVYRNKAYASCLLAFSCSLWSLS
jgi:hypothetical protein